jgi:hypothetical protein
LAFANSPSVAELVDMRPLSAATKDDEPTARRFRFTDAWRAPDSETAALDHIWELVGSGAGTPFG